MATDPQENPIPSHIPWYQSQQLRVLFASGISSIIAYAVTKGWIKVAPDASSIVELIFQLGAMGGALWAGVIRVVKPMPVIVANKATADAKSNTPVNLNPPSSSSTLKVHPFTVGFLAVMVIAALTQGCADLAVTHAKTPEQRAAALLGDFTTYQAASLKIGTDETVDPTVREKVLVTAHAANGPAGELDKALVEYRSIKSQLEAGATTQDKLTIASANLTKWILEVQPLVASMKKSVEGVRL